MIQKLKKYIIVTATSLIMLAPGLVPALAGNAFALAGAGSNVSSGLCQGIGAASGNGSTTCASVSSGNSGASTLSALATRVVNIFSIVVGVTAVFMIIYGGFRYITSGGDSGKVGNAKNTLIYAIIGLIIVALAQAIVHFVLDQSASASQTLSN